MKLLFLSATLILATSILTACRDETTWHQKLTLTFETPAGVTNAVSVTEVSWVGPNKLILRDLDGGSLGLVRGEAAMVEIIPGHWLFALLDGQERLLVDQLSHERGVEAALPDILAQQTPLVLPKKAWPILVTFDDPNDRRTVRVVEPLDSAVSFGAKVSLKTVTLQVTDEPITEGRIERVLVWLGRYPETPVLPETSATDFSFEAQLRQGSFIRIQ